MSVMKCNNGKNLEKGHVCIVESVNESAKTYRTIEGNTNVKGERDSLSGDGVWQKTRNHKLIRTLLRKE